MRQNEALRKHSPPTHTVATLLHYEGTGWVQAFSTLCTVQKVFAATNTQKPSGDVERLG